ncbi:hypothetical protein MMPV_004366 [Pyropia vietnamensis]
MDDADDGLPQYDEFGNYLGDDGESASSSAGASDAESGSSVGESDSDADGGGTPPHPANGDEDEEPPTSPGADAMAVVLPEDVQHYAPAAAVYGPDTEVRVEEVDAQPLSTPLVAPPVTRRSEYLTVDAHERSAVVPAFSLAYLAGGLCAQPALVRNAALVGALHHGKTGLLDMLVAATHARPATSGRGGGGGGGHPLAAWRPYVDGGDGKEVAARFTDARIDEQARAMSVKATPLTLLGTDLVGKSHALHLLDCPGHTSFLDETVAALRLVDVAVVVVDAAEGVCRGTELAVAAAAAARVGVLLVVTKLDRLVVELRLPVADAYHKLRHTVATFNELLVKWAPVDEGRTAAASDGDGAGDDDDDDADRAPATGPRRWHVTPEDGSVVFASAQSGLLFTLEQVADWYLSRAAADALTVPGRGDVPVMPASALARRLWGDVWFDRQRRVFTKRRPADAAVGSDEGGTHRSFVEFVLAPLYKVYAAAVGDPPDEVARKLNTIVLGEEEGVSTSLPASLGKAACGKGPNRRGRGRRQGSGGVGRRPQPFKAADLELDVHPLIRLCMGTLWGNCDVTGFVSALVAHAPSPIAGAGDKLAAFYTGALSMDGVGSTVHTAAADSDVDVVDDWDDDSEDPEAGLLRCLRRCDPGPRAPAVLLVAKLVPHPDMESFYALGRVMAGCLRQGDAVRVLGDGYVPVGSCAADDGGGDEEDVAEATVTGLYLPGGRYVTRVNAVRAGQVVLVDGVDGVMSGKGATLVSVGADSGVLPPEAHGPDADGEEEVTAAGRVRSRRAAACHVFAPLSRSLAVGPTTVTFKVAVEPRAPADLPALVRGLRALSASSPGLVTRVEESGEHVLLGAGEMALEVALGDLRSHYARVPLSVSDPAVPLAETVAETSALKVAATTPNGANSLTLIAGPLEEGLAEAIERGTLPLRPRSRLNPPTAATAAVAGVGVGAPPLRSTQARLQSEWGWDGLATRRLWAYGPEAATGGNVLIDDVLTGAGTPQRSALNAARGGIVSGFRWATREGPLTDSPVRSVKLRLLDATIAASPAARSGAQLIPTARRGAYAALLSASPRLLEPLLSLEATASSAADAAVVERVLSRRRGYVLTDVGVAASPLRRLTGVVPAMDAVGLETDIRLVSGGRVYVATVFDRWAVVPGDPLDADVVLRPLEAAPDVALARECLVKTRRRKGLADEVGIGRSHGGECTGWM